jgi:RNA polymerase sigma-70 factor (ECF subfamily)
MDSPTRSQTENTAYHEKTDEELIIICEADLEAFGELARRYQAMAFRAAFCVLRNELEAEDQVQTALCKALEHIGNFRRSAKFSTWLMRIVVNECLMHLRHTRRAAIVSLDRAGSETGPLEVRDERRSPEAVVAGFYLTRLLEREIRCIPPLLRNAFVLREVQQRPMPEVARTLGISVEAAKSRLSRAREELRKRLEPHLSTIGPRAAAIQPQSIRREPLI